MAMKSILISADNIDRLATKYAVEKHDYEDVLPIGMYLVADFGNEESFDVVAKVHYDETFNELGDIQNGFKAIEYKDG